MRSLTHHPQQCGGVSLTVSYAGKDATSTAQSESLSFASDQRLLHEIDELVEGVEDMNERVRVISRAIGHLQQMQAEIVQNT